MVIVDKYVTDEEERNILCDALGDKMSLIHEYGKRKEENGKREVIIDLFKSGMTAKEISDRLKMPLSELIEIQNSM